MQASPACSLCVAPAPGGFWTNLFSADFVPRAQCVGGRAEIIWLHTVSDAAIAAAYFSIPLALAYFVKRRRDLAFPRIFWLFAAFILACGLTHVLAVAAFWQPMYRLDGVVKAATAGLSIATAGVLWPLLPRALALPGPYELRKLNEELRAEIGERRRAEEELLAARQELSVRVRERTVELAEANRRLAAGLAEKEVVEESLRESRQRLQRRLGEIESLYSSAPVGMCFIDTDARMVRANRALAEIAGPSVRDGAGRPIRAALASAGAEAAALLEEECGRVIGSGRGSAERLLQVEVGPARRGRWWLLSSGPVRDEDGTVIGVNVLVQDVTEWQDLEERLKQSQKTEAVGQLAAGIAHEINNALTAIYGYLSLARTRMAPEHGAMPYLDRVLTAAEQAGHITKALLTFSRNDPARLAPVEVRQVVEQAMTLFSGLAPASIRVELDTAGAEGLMVNGDGTQLQQAVMNLAINARDAMPGGGVLRVSVKPWGNGGGGMARITIEDTGIGMTPQVRERMFEPFFTTKARGQGTGLGTSVVQGIVSSHGGDISVVSAPGRGTTFTIDLPVCDGADAAPAGGPPEVTARAAWGRGTVVLAEDNQAIRDLMARALREEGLAVVEAQDGQELMDQVTAMEIAGRPIAALVLDVDMPVRSGIECLQLLRGRGQMAPVVLVTGGPEGESQREARTRVLRKPFHMRDLVAAVREALEIGRRA